MPTMQNHKPKVPQPTAFSATTDVIEKADAVRDYYQYHSRSAVMRALIIEAYDDLPEEAQTCT